METRASNTMHAGDENLRPLRDALSDLLSGVAFAIVFGSAARGQYRSDSDVDLAADFSAPLGASELLALRARLSAAVGRPADLVDLRRAGPILRMQVLRHGRPLVINNRMAFERFRMSTPSEYYDYKLTRRPVEAAVRARGIT